MACNIISDRLLTEYLGLGSSNVLVGLAAIFAERACDAFVGFHLAEETATEYYPSFNHFVGDTFVDVDPTISLQRTERLSLKRRPVKLTGLQIWEDSDGFYGQKAGAFPSDSELTIGTDFIVDIDKPGGSLSGQIIRLSGAWASIEGSIKVTYKAGFSSTELKGELTGADDYYDASDVRQAVLLAAMKNYNELKKQQPGLLNGVGGPLNYEKIEGYEYAIDKNVSLQLYGMNQELPPISKKLLSRYVNYGARLIA